MRWVEAIPIFYVNGETMTLFLFNQVIWNFGMPHTIVIDHGSHFQNYMMYDLTLLLIFRQEHSSSYYP